MRDIIFLSFWAIFCPFTLLTTQKIKILKKWKEHLEMSSSYTCVPKITIMMYDSWDMECISHNALSFWATFCPFSPLLKQKKNKKSKNINKTEYIILLPMCTINENHMKHGCWNIRQDGQFFVILGHFLTFEPLRNSKNQNFEK